MESLVLAATLKRDTFRWRTREGVIMRLADMETSHVFNSMKMIFNHLAAAHGAEPVWFKHHYSDYKQHAKTTPNLMAAVCMFFIREIELRGDLPAAYRIPYTQILNQIKGIKSLQSMQVLST